MGAQSYDAVSQACNGLTIAQTKAVLSTTLLSTEQRAAILSTYGLAGAELEEAVAATQSATAHGVLSTVIQGVKNSFKGLALSIAANPMMAIATAVTVSIGLFSKYKQKLEETKREHLEEAQAAKEESDNLSSLIAKYKELAESENRDTPEVRAEILDIQTQIKDMVGAQADNLDLVNGKLDEEIKKLEVIAGKNNDALIRKQRTAYSTNKEAADKAYYHNGSAYGDSLYGKDVVTVDGDNGKIREQIVEIVEAALKEEGIDSKDANISIIGSDFDKYLGLFFNNNQNINEKLKIIDIALKALEQSKDFNTSDSELYTDLSKAYSELEKVAKEQEKSANNLLSSLTAKFATSGKDTIDSIDSYKKYRDGIIQKLMQDDTISSAVTDGFLNKESISAYVDSYLSTLTDVSEYYNQWQASQNSMTEQEARKYTEEQKAKLQTAMMDTPKLSFVELMDLEDENGETFSDKVDNYVNNVGTLKDALEKFEQGDFSNEDLYKLQNEFPELIDSTDDFDTAIKKLLNDTNNNMMGEFTSQFGKLKTQEDKQKLQEFMETVLELGEVVGNTEFSIDIEAETQGMEDFYTAVKESVSATGLSAKSIENLKERYKNLFADNPDKRQELMNQLFERSEHGIHLNVAALKELESEYEKTVKEEFKDELKDLTGQYNDLTEQINGCSDASQKATLYAKRQEVLDQINEVADLASQYEGLTSAFNKWTEAQETPDEDDMFQKLSSGLEDIKTLFEEGRVGVDDFREAVQLMTDTDMSNASIDELLAMYDSGIGTMERFFTGNGEGLQSFLDMLVNVSTQAGETWATVDELGNYQFDFGVGDDSKITEAINNMTDLQMSTEEVQILLRALSAYGFDINLDSVFSKIELLETDFESLESEVENASQKLNEIGATDFKFNINTDDVSNLDTQVGEIYQTILDMYATNENKELNIKYSDEDFQYAEDILSALIAQKESLNNACVLKIDTTTADDDIHNAIAKLQGFQSSYSVLDSLVAVGADTTEARAEVDKWRQEILGENTALLASLKLDNTSIDTLYTSINAITPEMLVKAGVDKTEVDAFIAKDKNDDSTVKYNVDDSEVDNWLNQNHDTSANVVFHSVANEVYDFINNLPDVHRNVYYHSQGDSNANGTANVNGTAYAKGTAFKRGDWGTKDSGTALVGELGVETLVRDGMYQTIGDNGAEFIRYRKGDIIFNHRQTEELFKNGRVTSGGGRGKVFADGTAFSSGSGKIRGKGKVHTEPSNGSSGGGSSDGGSSTFSPTEEITYEKIDWVEIALDRISRAVDKLKKKATSVYNTFATRNRNLAKEMGKVREQIEKNLAGAERYEKEAWDVGLDEDLAKKVRDGTIDINDYDSDTADKIKEYQQWWEKAVEAREAAEELKETLKDLYKEKFDNAVTNWTNKLEIYGHTIDRISSRIEQRTNKASKYVNPDNAVSAYQGNIKDYKKIVNEEKKELNQLEKERDDLTSLMWDAVYSGDIAYGSEAYYDMLQQIHDVESDIDNLNQEIIDNTNEIAAQYENIFNSISSKYEMILNYAEKTAQKYTAQMELAEAKGLMASTYYYNQLRSKEQMNLKQLQEEQKKLQKALSDALSSGAIKYGSEAWYEMKSAIQEVDNEIIDTTKDIVEYGNQIRQIRWDRFDTLQDKIKNVEDETEFLVDLLSKYNLHTDKGQLTDEGMSTLGLYAIDYDLLVNQAKDYADEIKKIQKEIAKDPLNTDLIERREELLKNQQQSIKAAEKEKEAIVNLVEKGIKLELSSLKDLISTYTESLESAKDLYEYQKKIKSQTSDITNLQKQLAAYAGDTSEENRARIQKITVDLAEAQEELAETEYDQFVSDSKKLLDNLYSEYETILNERLDNVDGLVREMIDTVNANSSDISQTIKNVSSELGYILTNELKDILGGNKPIASYYDSKFGTSNTNVNNVVDSIESNLYSMVNDKSPNSITKFKTSGTSASTSLTQRNSKIENPKFVLNPQDTISNNSKLTEAFRQKATIPLTYCGSEYSGYLAKVGHNIGGAETIKEMLDKFGNFEGTEMNVTQEFNLGGIQIDRVEDYNDFVNKLKQDAKFEKMINAMTVDRLAGGSKFAKNKYKWD